MKRHLGTCGLLAVVLLAAASGAHGAENASEANTGAGQLFKWINFAIVAGALGWIFLKITPKFFHKRAEEISSAIRKASAAKAEADALLKDAEGKLARLEQEVAQLRAAGEREAVAEAERLRRATQADAEKIGLAAKAEIEAAERAARLELKAFAANLAVSGAESLLARQLTAGTQESLIGAFLKNLEGQPN